MNKRITALFVLLVIGFSQLLAQSSGNQMAQMVEQYDADTRIMYRANQLRESPKYFNRMETFYEDWLTKLETVDYGNLNTQEAVDFILLRRDIRRDLQGLQQDAQSYEEIEYTVRFAGTIFELQKDREIGNDIDGALLADTLNALVGKIRSTRQEVREQGRLQPADSRRAVEVAENLHETMEHIYSFYDSYDPDVTWWGEKSYENVDTTFANYVSFLEDYTVDQSHLDDGSGIIGNPVGAQELQELLDYEMIPYTASELIELANEEYAWCMDEMLKASRELGYGDDWHAALEHVKKSYVPAGKQPEMIYDLAIESIDFVEERDLLTIPELAKDTWDM